VDFALAARGDRQLSATIKLPERGELPKSLEVSFRLPSERKLVSLTANGHPIEPGGQGKDTAIFETLGHRLFDVIATLD
jgi:hypothetical protein